MKILVRSDDQVYEVEVGDVHVRPIIARIAGEQYEVWPEAIPTGTTPRPAADPGPAKVVPLHRPDLPPISSTERARPAPAVSEYDRRCLHTPLPGVIIAIMVQRGQLLTVRQEVCVLEAMKMQNTIRATRAGRIAAVLVAVDQQVQHNDVLIEYAD